MTIHRPYPSLIPHICATCGHDDSDPVFHWAPLAETVSPKREPEPVAVARRTDPSTSWEAARSVTKIRESQEEVLFIFKQFGPTTDEEAYEEYVRAIGKDCAQSVSGFRTRRSELVKVGRIVDTGERWMGKTGRRMIVWAAT